MSKSHKEIITTEIDVCRMILNSEGELMGVVHTKTSTSLPYTEIIGTLNRKDSSQFSVKYYIRKDGAISDQGNSVAEVTQRVIDYILSSGMSKIRG